MVMPPHTNRGTSFAGPRLRLGRRASSEPTCGAAVTEVLATLPTGAFVTAETVQSLGCGSPEGTHAAWGMMLVA